MVIYLNHKKKKENDEQVIFGKQFRCVGSVMAYLCRLITPQGGTILDPFMGSGSTGIASKLEGFDFVGIEMEDEYFKIAESRINQYEMYRSILKK